MDDAIRLEAKLTRTGRQPNILILFSDQHNANMSGFMGSKTVHTPNLDRLANQSAVFDNAYCNAPLCSPSRQSLMAGLHCYQIGCWDNTTAMPEDTVTWAHMLSQAGYETSLIGKMHFNGYQKMYGFDRRPVLEGSNDGQSFHSWGVRASCDWSKSIGRYEPILQDIKSASADVPERQPIFQKDLEVLAGTLRELEAKARVAKDPQAQPWAICSSFVLPHPPFKARTDILKTYAGKGDLPFNREGAGRDLCDQALQYYCGDLNKLSDEQIRRAREVYFALITEYDEYAGKILDLLDKTGLSENTVVFYFSDHGEMAGEHGLWSKITLLESSVRVPMMVRWPGRIQPGLRIGAPVSLVDIFPTLIDIAGIAMPEPLRLAGRSLVPLVTGMPNAYDDRYVFCEFEGEGWPHPRSMLRKGRYKYVYNHSADTRLYDLGADPHEMQNLAGRPELAHLEASFRNHLTSFWNPNEIEFEVRASQVRRKIARNKNVCKDCG